MAEATNKLKSDVSRSDQESEKTEIPEQKEAAKEPRKKREKKSSTSGVNSFLKDERTPKVAGLFFLLSSLYLFVAFVSYLFTWKVDQDKVFHFTWSNLFNGDFRAENYLGRLGAYVSHFFIYSGFGVTSFLCVGLLLTSGSNLLLRRKIFNVARFFKFSLFALVLLPAALSFCFQSFDFPFGGAVGNTINTWLNGFLGIIGTGALLFFFVLFFGVIVFN